MNVFLVGNGFDLHHKFPTRYIDFLHVMKFLIKEYNPEMNTVGKILGSESLQNNNPFIKVCYEQHAFIYDGVDIDGQVLISLIEQAKRNLWFGYLAECTDKDIKWIDFEKEVLLIIEMVEGFFGCEPDFSRYDNTLSVDFNSIQLQYREKYLLGRFSFFLDEIPSLIRLELGAGYKKLGKEYVLEKPLGSACYVLNKDKIVDGLYDSLRELAYILKTYLNIFVDTVARSYFNYGILPQCKSYPTPDRVYTFNYTNTMEILHDVSAVIHIHGKVEEDIVLGVNPDKRDELGGIDTTFLQFKKYFQRCFFNTDAQFIKQMNDIRPNYNDKRHVYVIGHSLDVTDGDIIQQVFDWSHEITVLYHEKGAVKSYIKNLVELYGKDQFDRLRADKKLKFLSQAEIQWGGEDSTV